MFERQKNTKNIHGRTFVQTSRISMVGLLYRHQEYSSSDDRTGNGKILHETPEKDRNNLPR